jgi:hypothetical protein
MKKARCQNGKRAQVTLEFTLVMIMMLMLFYGMVMIFRWAGVSLIEREKAYENSLLSPVNEDWGKKVGGQIYIGEGPLNQVNPRFYEMDRLRAVYGE